MLQYFLLSVLLGCNSEESLKIHNSKPTATISSHAEWVELLETVEYTFVGRVADDKHPTSQLKGLSLILIFRTYKDHT